MNYKTMIAPLVAIIALAIKGLLGIEVGEDLQAQITDWVATGIFVGITIYGVFKNHKKEDGKNE